MLWSRKESAFAWELSKRSHCLLSGKQQAFNKRMSEFVLKISCRPQHPEAALWGTVGPTGVFSHDCVIRAVKSLIRVSKEDNGAVLYYPTGRLQGVPRYPAKQGNTKINK